MEYQETGFEGSSDLPKLGTLGNEGWELADLRPAGHHVGTKYAQYLAILRRDPGAGTWEYHIFNTAEVPGSWHEHIRSLGWVSVGVCIYMYYGVSLYVFKRPGTWAGADDGDIVQRLWDLGWQGRANDPEMLQQILDLKWRRSQEEGRDVGTYRAVRLWLAHDYLRRLYKDLPAGREEQILDELLAFRRARGTGEAAPPLYSLIEEWRALQR
jgi:hypothetical protein